MINIINLTPHKINLYKDNCLIESIPSSGIARCESVKSILYKINDINVYTISYGEVYGLPNKKEETIYIVSNIVAQALKGIRDDVYVVQDTIRNQEGQIIGCNGLAKI